MIPTKGLDPNVRITKPAGWDWIVYYLDDDGPEILAMSVFGQMRPEDAISEARFSLGATDANYEIIGLLRGDRELPL